MLDRVLAVDLEAEIIIIVVDDGSTDGTREALVERAAREDAGIAVVLHEINRGRGKGAALRTGITRATGDYVIACRTPILEYATRLISPGCWPLPTSTARRSCTDRAIRVLCDWLVIHQVLPVNPAAAVRGPKHVVAKGATPVLTPAETRSLLDGIDAGPLPTWLCRPRRASTAHLSPNAGPAEQLLEGASAQALGAETAAAARRVSVWSIRVGSGEKVPGRQRAGSGKGPGFIGANS